MLFLILVGILFLIEFNIFVTAISVNKQPTPNNILLKSRQFTPDKEYDVSFFSSLTNKHFLIQLENFPIIGERKALENAGIKLLDYIPNKAWFVSLDKITPRQAVNLVGVKWIGDILAEDKISSYIIEKGIGEWARDEKGTNPREIEAV